MNYTFATGAERIHVIEDLRKPDVIFPSSWNPLYERQQQSKGDQLSSSSPSLTLLCSHPMAATTRPGETPQRNGTVAKLPATSSIGGRVFQGCPEDDECASFHYTIKLHVDRMRIAKLDSPHYHAVLASLFGQPPRPVRSFVYDREANWHEHASLNDIIQDTLAAIFRLHGALDMEPPLFMPISNRDDEYSQALFLDRHGDVLTLPNNLLVPFARLAGRNTLQRIKRYHISNIYRPAESVS